MSENNSVEDSYNPPGIGTDFEEFNFEDVEIDDLIWITNTSSDGIENPAHRKVNDNSARLLRTGQMVDFHPRQKVYQKT
jgi:hypothetical protein